MTGTGHSETIMRLNTFNILPIVCGNYSLISFSSTNGNRCLVSLVIGAIESLELLEIGGVTLEHTITDLATIEINGIELLN